MDTGGRGMLGLRVVVMGVHASHSQVAPVSPRIVVVVEAEAQWLPQPTLVCSVGRMGSGKAVESPQLGLRGNPSSVAPPWIHFTLFLHHTTRSGLSKVPETRWAALPGRLCLSSLGPQGEGQRVGVGAGRTCMTLLGGHVPRFLLTVSRQ